jgi:hypothetical protein
MDVKYCGATQPPLRSICCISQGLNVGPPIAFVFVRRPPEFQFDGEMTAWLTFQRKRINISV